jgi:hypothetical protein
VTLGKFALVAAGCDRFGMKHAWVWVLLAACGGKPAEAPAGEPPPATATPPLSEPEGTATPPVAPTAEAPTSDSAPGSVSTGDNASEAPDECAKVAAPFEEKVRPLFNKCYQEGKKKNPELAGVAKIAISVNTLGKVTSVKPAGTSELGDSVIGCIVKAVKAEPFDGSLCKARTVTVSKQYGGKK